MTDLNNWIEKWKNVQDGLEGSYTAVVLTPQYDNNPNTPDFFWMGTWPDAAAMGAGQMQYFEEGAGAGVDAELAKILTCRSSLWWGRTVFKR